MPILFDQGTPVPLRRFLTGHAWASAYERGWSSVTNGDLILLAEQEGFELLISINTNLRVQRKLQSRSLTILVLTTTSWPQLHLATASPGHRQHRGRDLGGRAWERSRAGHSLSRLVAAASADRGLCSRSSLK
jgi:hypothetical protein